MRSKNVAKNTGRCPASAMETRYSYTQQQYMQTVSLQCFGVKMDSPLQRLLQHRSMFLTEGCPAEILKEL